MTQTSRIDRDASETKIVEKALKDATFKQALLTDARSAIGRELGIDIPADVTVNVVQESPTNYYLVLPHVDIAETELNDLELEAVAGGKAKPAQTTCGACYGGTSSSMPVE